MFLLVIFKLARGGIFDVSGSLHGFSFPGSTGRGMRLVPVRKHDNPAAFPVNSAAEKTNGVSRRREYPVAFRTRCKQRGAG
jgi:hypothetical protein